MACHAEGNSLAIATRLDVEGLTAVEIWQGEPEAALPVIVYSGALESAAGWLEVSDADSYVRMEIRGLPCSMKVQVFTEGGVEPGRVQIAIRAVNETRG